MHNRPVVPGRAQLSRCQAEMAWWRNYAALARYARPDHLPPLEGQDRRRLWPRPQRRIARIPVEIPQQRAAPRGLPARPVTAWGRRSNR